MREKWEKQMPLMSHILDHAQSQELEMISRRPPPPFSGKLRIPHSITIKFAHDLRAHPMFGKPDLHQPRKNPYTNSLHL